MIAATVVITAVITLRKGTINGEEYMIENRYFTLRTRHYGKKVSNKAKWSPIGNQW